jgi:hypothetical protein
VDCFDDPNISSTELDAEHTAKLEAPDSSKREFERKSEKR